LSQEVIKTWNLFLLIFCKYVLLFAIHAWVNKAVGAKGSIGMIGAGSRHKKWTKISHTSQML
jgi:hypothetical protein